MTYTRGVSKLKGANLYMIANRLFSWTLALLMVLPASGWCCCFNAGGGGDVTTATRIENKPACHAMPVPHASISLAVAGSTDGPLQPTADDSPTKCPDSDCSCPDQFIEKPMDHAGDDAIFASPPPVPILMVPRPLGPLTTRDEGDRRQRAVPPPALLLRSLCAQHVLLLV